MTFRSHPIQSDYTQTQTEMGEMLISMNAAVQAVIARYAVNGTVPLANRGAMRLEIKSVVRNYFVIYRSPANSREITDEIDHINDLIDVAQTRKVKNEADRLRVQGRIRMLRERLQRANNGSIAASLSRAGAETPYADILLRKFRAVMIDNLRTHTDIIGSALETIGRFDVKEWLESGDDQLGA